MKKLCFMFAMMLVAAPLAAQTIHIGYFESPPYVFRDDNGKLRGATVEFLEESIAPAMGIRFVWTDYPIPIARQLDLMQKNKLDASAVLAKNLVRQKILDYPDTPYFITRSTLAVPQSSSLIQVGSVSDIVSLKIGYCTKTFISPFMRDERIQWDLLAGSSCTRQNFKKLIAGRIDAQYQPDVPPLLYYARKTRAEDIIRLVFLPDKVAIYTPFSKQAGSRYLKRYNQALKDTGGTENYMTYLARYMDISKLSGNH